MNLTKSYNGHFFDNYTELLLHYRIVGLMSKYLLRKYKTIECEIVEVAKEDLYQHFVDFNPSQDMLDTAVDMYYVYRAMKRKGKESLKEVLTFVQNHDRLAEIEIN